jgi:hypothetical protein
MPTRTVTRTVTVTEPQICQAVADWLRHRHSYPAAAADVRVGGDDQGRAVAEAAIEITVVVPDGEAAAPAGVTNQTTVPQV